MIESTATNSKYLEEGKIPVSVLTGIADIVGVEASNSVRANIKERATQLYAPWKNKNYKGNRLLYLTGRMHDSIRYSLVHISDEIISVEYGSDVIYAARQHYGGGGVIPRPFVKLIPSEQTRIEGIIQKQLEESING